MFFQYNNGIFQYRNESFPPENIFFYITITHFQLRIFILIGNALFPTENDSF